LGSCIIETTDAHWYKIAPEEKLSKAQAEMMSALLVSQVRLVLCKAGDSHLEKIKVGSEAFPKKEVKPCKVPKMG